MRLNRHEAGRLTGLGVVTPSYLFEFNRLDYRSQTRLRNMLNDGVCTNIGRLEPLYNIITRLANIPSMAVRKAQDVTNYAYSWPVWVERPPSDDFWGAVQDLVTADVVAYNLTHDPNMHKPYSFGRVDPATGLFYLSALKSTDKLREFASEQWAGSPEYKQAVKNVIALMESGEPIWFN